MREEPKLFSSGAPQPQPQPQPQPAPEDRLSLFGIEADGAEADDGYDDGVVADDYEEYDERPRRRIPWKIIGALVAVAIGGVGAAMFLGVGETPVQVADVPLITADPAPFKHRPDDPGGMEVPYQDVEVFGTLDEEAGEAEEGYEVLLPEPEEPLATMPEETVVEATDDGTTVIDLGDGATVGDETVDLGAATETGASGAASSLGTPPVPQQPPERLDYAEPIETAGESQAEPSAGAVTFDDVAASLSGGEVTQPQTVAPAAGGPKVQVAAYGSEQNARDAWAFLQDQNRDLLDGYQPIIDKAVLETGTFYRLQIGPFASDADAKRMCDSLRGRNVDCVIVAP